MQGLRCGDVSQFVSGWWVRRRVPGASSAKRGAALEPICAKNHTRGNTLAHMDAQLNPVSCAMSVANRARAAVLNVERSLMVSTFRPLAIQTSLIIGFLKTLSKLRVSSDLFGLTPRASPLIDNILLTEPHYPKLQTGLSAPLDKPTMPGTQTPTPTPTPTKSQKATKSRPSLPSVSLSTPPPDTKEVTTLTSPTAAEENINHPPHPNGGAHTFFRFEGLTTELNTQLQYVRVEDGEKTNSNLPTPWFLKSKDPNKPYLPGQPRIRLDERPRHVDGPEGKLDGYLRRWHLTDKLDQLLPLMRYIFVQTPAYDHINALHHHAAHTRKIVVDEEPGLHLVWYYEIIFMKPIPPYFFSRAFWLYIEHADPEVYGASLGFMRSYYHIIRFEIDFHEACKKKLMPRKDNGKFPTYEEWCEFIEPFSLVGDKHVSRRYRYGELRLTRINRAAMFFRFNLAYFHLLPQWGSFLSHILAPLITAFAVCSVILNSMQVTLAAIEVANETNHTIPDPEGWRRFMNVSLYFPIIVILSIALVIAVTLVSMFLMGLKDLLRGNKVRRKKENGEARVGKGSHGMVW